MCVRVCACVCACVCLYPGYVQSPGWDGRTLHHLQNLAGKNVTVKVPPQHQVMVSFKDVHMKGTLASKCQCHLSSVIVQTDKRWTHTLFQACDFIFLSPVLRDTEQMKVLVRTGFPYPECPISEKGESVHCVLFDYIPFDDDW